MKCRWNRGWAASQAVIAGVLWVDKLSADQMHVEFVWDGLVDLVEELLELIARCRRWMEWMTSPVVTSRAANRSVVPARA